ncbi:MAG: EamA family transporter [Spirulinaceae cyanobacterium]
MVQEDNQSEREWEIEQSYLKDLSIEINSLQEQLIQPLHQEVQQLEEKKVRLLQEIEQLELQKEVITPPPKPQLQKSLLTKLGFFLAFLSTLCLACQNIVIAIILNPSSVFGNFAKGGYLTPGVTNSLLILWLRMLVVVPLLFIVSRFIHPSSWQVIKKVIDCQDWGLTSKVIACGFLLFLSQLLIYLSLGFLPVGVAVTLFFIFPLATILFTWFLFGESPNLIRTIIIVITAVGLLLTILLGKQGEVSFSWLGITTAIGSGITFAIYLLITQLCAKKLHPVPFSVLNFLSILLFSFLGLLIILPFNNQFSLEPEIWTKLIISGFLLGTLTLLSYLSSNISIRFIGAGASSTIGAVNPGLTACLGWFILGQGLGKQFWGIGLVTFGIIALSLVRISSRK